MTETLTPEDVTTFTPTAPLTAHDRCDRCGAQAYTRFINENGHDMLFCGHHTTKYEVTLMKTGFQMIQDNRAMLDVKRESSAA